MLITILLLSLAYIGMASIDGPMKTMKINISLYAPVSKCRVYDKHSLKILASPKPSEKSFE